MKKFTCCLLACLACFQSSYALEESDNRVVRAQVGATSAFTESAREMEAILNAIADGDFPVVKPNEFAVTLFRETQKVDTTGKINYVLETCLVGKKNKCDQINKYRVVIRVERNGIGPNQITVLSVKRIKRN